MIVQNLQPTFLNFIVKFAKILIWKNQNIDWIKFLFCKFTLKLENRNYNIFSLIKKGQKYFKNKGGFFE